MKRLQKIGFGGGCHWCTEAVFQSLKGVENVEQGWIASNGDYKSLSEAVIVSYDPEEINLTVLTEIHLHTHQSTSNHSMRIKYRSAVYFFIMKDELNVVMILKKLQICFDQKIITKVLPFNKFETSREAIQNYYAKNPEKPFCKTYINPKLNLLKRQFSKYVKYVNNSHTIT